MVADVLDGRGLAARARPRSSCRSRRSRQSLNNAASPQLSESALRKRQRAAEALAERLNLVPVDVSVRFAPLTVSSADLLSLAVGDVLLLRHPPDAPLEVTTNDVTFAYAIASNHRRRLAAAIVPTPNAARRTPHDHRPHRLVPGLADRHARSSRPPPARPPRWCPPPCALVPGTPVSDPDRVPLPPAAASAVTARLSGEVSGDVVLVLSADVVDALENSPVGKMDVAAALRPALEAAAATLGRVRVASERVEEPVAALDGLRDKGMFVAVPLLADGEHQATFALQVTLPQTPRSQRGSLELLPARGHGGHRRDRPHPHDRAASCSRCTPARWSSSTAPPARRPTCWSTAP